MEIYKISNQCDIKEILFKFKNDLFDKNIANEQLEKLSIKFAKFAIFIVLSEGVHQPLGYIAIYCNDMKNHTAFISMITVKNIYRHMGLGTVLIKEAIKSAKVSGMKEIAFQFYRKHGFTKVDQTDDYYCMKKKNI
ncbi:MAG: GNAT family N-acetyltransferase [Lachnospiraceae bacterium]|jgi:ribosomal protein S18 acetylase RimI-like enzyme|nr:GNAT family N-acetyltransferase [Lachnospiraceae bacterium]